MEASNNTNERRLCTGCQTFWGTESTNFLCSSCYKKEVNEATSPSKTFQIPSSASAAASSAVASDSAASTSDVQKAVEIEKKDEMKVDQVENKSAAAASVDADKEEVKEEKKVQVSHLISSY